MKTANSNLDKKTSALNGGASQQSLTESYQVPALDGRMVQATPLKFCLNYRPPTIAVVYTFQHSSKKKAGGKIRKYIREIKVDFKSCSDSITQEKPSKKQLDKLCQTLCDKEPSYLNINIISKQQVSVRSECICVYQYFIIMYSLLFEFDQVLKLIYKLFEHEYGCEPADTPRQADSKAPEAAKKDAKAKDDDDEYSYYNEDEDDFELDSDKEKDKKPSDLKSVPPITTDIKKTTDDQDEDSDWDMADDGFGEIDQLKKEDSKVANHEDDNKAGVNVKEIAEKQKRDLFFGGAGGASEGGDDFDLDQMDLDMLDKKEFDDKNEDKFNQILSTSKENGGLLASIGLKRGENDESIGDESQEEDPHKKSDLFDTSKDRGAAKNANMKDDGMQSDEDDFDLGFGLSKKEDDDAADIAKGNAAGNTFEGEGQIDVDDAEHAKIIDDQFQAIYEKDPELRKALEKSDVSTFNTYEKFQILEAYSQGGGAGALQIELADDEDEFDLLNEMTDEDKQNLEEQFDGLYASDPVLQEELGPLENLNL